MFGNSDLAQKLRFFRLHGISGKVQSCACNLFLVEIGIFFRVITLLQYVTKLLFLWC